MVVLRILEINLYLFFSFIVDYIELDLVSILEILGSLLVVDMIKNLTGIYFERAAQVQERKGIAERADDKVERTGVPVVHSLMVFKMCEGLGLPAQLLAESDRKIWVAKNKPRPVSKVHSKMILMFCEASNLDAVLTPTSPE
ncbi:uncharacterized protein TNIN_30811 [Trichonephila inaurata madagascariensis]|uniref:Uncharacterized protein n=1 Tax=Trichonephila inaurata madagascariensis TaxID=2747483 RepID=A0A8X6M7S1_9ARAC|nr:uncharacterized protein TNIN_30811 [Trichonephila inaurata madagascariensis]